MIDLLDIRYVRLGTRDLDAADRFAREVVGLEAAREEAGARYYRSDDRDHTLVYFEGGNATPRGNCGNYSQVKRAGLFIGCVRSPSSCSAIRVFEGVFT